jgi:serine/threonine protein kinase
VEDEVLFEQEVSTLVALRHPNIVLFIGVCTADSYKLIVTEYLENQSLDTHLKYSETKQRHKAFSFKKKIEILMDVTKGMQYLHSLGMIHRDLKSSNLLVSFIMKICADICYSWTNTLPPKYVILDTPSSWQVRVR